MSTLEGLRGGLSRFLGTVAEGWHQLVNQASGALTRFKPAAAKEGDAGLPEPVRGVGWGLLAAELYEGGDNVVVRLEAPSMTREDFDLSVVDDLLLVHGEKC